MRRRASFGTSLFCKPGATQEKLLLARRMRRSPTEGEAILWSALRHRGLEGWKFRRQAVLSGYIVDFHCPELRFVVEVDGPIHEERRAHDAERDDALRAGGLHILRVPEDDVRLRTDAVLQAIAERCRALARCR